MKRTIFALSLLAAFTVAKAQQPHTVVGYTPNSNTITALHYGLGNTLESITIAGQTQTTIKVSPNGQPQSISNGLATMSYTFAGTSNVAVAQTVNGETKTNRVPLNSNDVLQFRKEFSSAMKSLSSAVDKADKFLENGGASLIGKLINTISDGLENPINVCFQEALDAAQNTKNPIIPINCLEALVEATKSHESVGDELKGKAVDYIFDNYKDWRDGWSNLVLKGMMEIDKLQNVKNKETQQSRLNLAKLLLDDGASLEEAAKAVEDFFESEAFGPDADKADRDYDESEDEVDGDDNAYPTLENPDDIVAYVTQLAKGANRGGLPTTINVSYNRYSIYDPISYDLDLNPDKKTYSTKNYTPENLQGLGNLLDEPFVYLIIWWPKADKNNKFSETKEVRIAKEKETRKHKWSF